MLRGLVADVRGSEVIVDVGGVGYRVTCLAPSELTDANGSGLSVDGDGGGAAWPVGDEVILWVHTHVREDALVLYGFASRTARDRFEDLLGAHGVGPSLALAILSSLTPEELVECVLDDDADSLTRVPGVGKKTALRLIIDLKSKFEALGPLAAITGLGARPSRAGSTSVLPALAEARAALAELGYLPEEIKEATSDLDTESDAGRLLKLALRELAGSRR